MSRWITFTLLALHVLSAHAMEGLPRWDAVPAVDVLHLDGPYRGRTVCPMCQHGYDAGVLVFLPVDTPIAQAARVAGAMQDAATAAGNQRFRPFLVLTGATPSPALLEAVRGHHANWYVAHLADADLARASRDFGVPLQTQTYGLVFAQRRLLWAFDAAAETTSWSVDLVAHAGYAMSFLQATYADANPSVDPDTPKGRLWLAPDRLTNIATFAEGAIVSTCFDDGHRGARGNALVAMTAADAPSGTRTRTRWARTDAQGCASLQGVGTLPEIHVELFTTLEPAVDVRLDSRMLRAGERVEVSLDAAPMIAVTGREPVIGSCEGCEGIFQGLPTTPDATTHLAPIDEPGDTMQLSGTVFDPTGAIATGIIVYAYQTDHTGVYPDDARLTSEAARHGRLRAWTRTDAAGRYRFHTIRPGAYPDGSEAEHIHLHILEPGRCTYYVGDVMFTDDSRLAAARLERERLAPGGSGVVTPGGNATDGWTVVRDIRLGLNVPGYRACGGRDH